MNDKQIKRNPIKKKYKTDIRYLYRSNMTAVKKLAKVLRGQLEDLEL